ncbi:amidohydrolase [Schizosaccharomyces japonicus yFS275]|uniref:Amidohydrolase n=1 Tax=Schizosaccharomyces japonicus (strain yFS275 / FY16936) TaxID=402676 RepID=B6K212_SCHJY|nr:amidohydrolase [Schizosaccharomyces japonicus yFS275]EEB07193.1 amidohydrolase [Schizosaccharomyces japonicus yFS275]
MNRRAFISFFRSTSSTLRNRGFATFCPRKHPQINLQMDSPYVPTDFKPFRLGLVQLLSGMDKMDNLKNARTKVLEAAKNGANIVVLPEIFNSPYSVAHFREYAEDFVTTSHSPSYDALSQMAKDAKVYLFGGSIVELDNDKVYNTALVFSPDGSLLGKHRKMHLFDVDIPNGIRFIESEVLSPGNAMTMVQTEFGKFGMGICYDIRFPELAMIAARNGCAGMIYPSAFNTTTGPLHWELLARSRAVDNQIFVALCSPARNMDASYHAYGHSMAVDPYGKILAEAQEGPAIIYADINPTTMEVCRRAIPLYTQRRFDMYTQVQEQEASKENRGKQ